MLNLKEIETSIEARRNKIFLLMEEVRRLRIQQKIKVLLCCERLVGLARHLHTIKTTGAGEQGCAQ